MVYNAKYNGLEFFNAPILKKGGSLILKEFSFFEISTSASTEKYAIRHGEYVSPTEMKNRRIRLLFDIVAKDEEERWFLLKKVQKAFTPEINPSPFNPRLRKELTFLDVNCVKWTCKCQVLQGIQLSDFANEKRVGISVELITDSPYFYSDHEDVFETTNTRLWKKFSFQTPMKFQYYRDYLDYEGAISWPLLIEMKITDTDFPLNFIKVTHQVDGIEWILMIENLNSLNLTVWNIISLDTDKRRCYLTTSNWTSDITWLVTLWSNRPLLELGENLLAVDTWRRGGLEIKVKRRNAF